MNQNNIELCKTTEFWWVDRPEPLKNQNWQRSLEWTGEILRSYESNNTEKIGFDEKNKKNKTRANKKTNWKTNTKGKKQEKPKRKLRILVSCFFLVFLFLLVIFPVDFCFWWFCFFCFFVLFVLLKSTFSVLNGVIMQESSKNWIKISEQERRCFGLRIFLELGVFRANKH